MVAVDGSDTADPVDGQEGITTQEKEIGKMAKRFSAKYAAYKELSEVFEAIDRVAERMKAS